MSQPATHHTGISLNALSFQYARASLFSRGPAPRILHDIDLHVPPGRTVGLVGESGSGKSTIAKLMLGLLAPTQGQALLDGRPLSAMPARARARRIQMVFQDPYSSLNPRRTISEILTSPLRVHGIGDAASRAASVRRMMDAVGLVPACVEGSVANEPIVVPRVSEGGQAVRDVEAPAAWRGGARVPMDDESRAALEGLIRERDEDGDGRVGIPTWVSLFEEGLVIRQHHDLELALDGEDALIGLGLGLIRRGYDARERAAEAAAGDKPVRAAA